MELMKWEYGDNLYEFAVSNQHSIKVQGQKRFIHKPQLKDVVKLNQNDNHPLYEVLTEKLRRKFYIYRY
jgi:glutathione peroxidase-family protein